MRILQINTIRAITATGRISEDIEANILNAGGESYIAFGRNRCDNNTYRIPVGDRWDMYVHGISSLLGDNHGLASVKATLRLLREIDRINPDIIHLHNIHGYFIHYPVLFDYLKRKNYPVVWTLHDCWTFTGHCAFYEQIGCTKWQTGCYDCPQLRTYPASFFKDQSKRNWELKRNSFLQLNHLTLVPVSRWLSKELENSFFSGQSVRCITNGIDLSKFYRDIPLNGELDFPYVIGVAYPWTRRKGLADFLKLAEILPVNTKIILIGLSVRQQIGLPSSIIGFKRIKSRDRLRQLYSKALALVNLTYEDTFPTVNLEALACGTPVITYNSGGSPESVCKETGVVIPKGRYDMIGGALDMLNQTDREILAIKCRKRAEEHYNHKKQFDQYIDLYKELLKEHKHENIHHNGMQE